MGDFCCADCTATANALRASLSAARAVLEAALLVREIEDFLSKLNEEI